jgi:putative Mg2+ transporter-C (MgtC) family protein
VGTFDEGRVTLELTLAARMRLAALLGFLVGLERESRGKSAGERTFAIVALGFAGVAISMFPDTAGQAVAGVATGIGFLGVGIIWRAEEGQTRGPTTAASMSPRSASWRASACTAPPCSGRHWRSRSSSSIACQDRTASIVASPAAPTWTRRIRAKRSPARERVGTPRPASRA